MSTPTATDSCVNVSNENHKCDLNAFINTKTNMGKEMSKTIQTVCLHRPACDKRNERTTALIIRAEYSSIVEPASLKPFARYTVCIPSAVCRLYIHRHLRAGKRDVMYARKLKAKASDRWYSSKTLLPCLSANSVGLFLRCNAPLSDFWRSNTKNANLQSSQGMCP